MCVDCVAWKMTCSFEVEWMCAWLWIWPRYDNYIYIYIYTYVYVYVCVCAFECSLMVFQMLGSLVREPSTFREPLSTHTHAQKLVRWWDSPWHFEPSYQPTEGARQLRRQRVPEGRRPRSRPPASRAACPRTSGFGSVGKHVYVCVYIIYIYIYIYTRARTQTHA